MLPFSLRLSWKLASICFNLASASAYAASSANGKVDAVSSFDKLPLNGESRHCWDEGDEEEGESLLSSATSRSMTQSGVPNEPKFLLLSRVGV